jgi:serpin B
MAAVPAAAFLSACGGSGAPTPVGVEQSTQSRATAPSVPAADATLLASDNQAFAVDLYQKLRGQAGPDDNLVFSPVSISLALAMLYDGAETETASQMASTLHFTLPVDRLNAAFDALDLALTTPPSGGDAGMFQLSLANSTWIQQGFPILPAYLDTLAESYGAGINTVDFETAPEDARSAINGWVASQTQDQIPTLFPAGSITAATRLVLANAVYFHGDWATPFEPNSPNATFHAASGDVSVPMMSGQEGNATVWSGTGWTAAALPYVGDTTSMVLVVPDAGTFDSFEAGLTADSLAAMVVASGVTSFATVSMPRFKFSLATSLNDTLAALGMPDAFDEATADFSGIDGDRDLSVQAVVHRADIAVDEKGTTAAAATGISVIAAIATTPLIVDRPFLFFILHQPTGALLFAGRVVDPTATN